VGKGDGEMDRYTLAMTDEQLRSEIAGCERTITDAGWHDNYTDAARASKSIARYKQALAIPYEERQQRVVEMLRRERRLQEILSQPELDGPAF
jgi:trehalose-6-phosphate synthase